MKTMRVVIAACAVLAATSSVAKADLVLVNGTPSASFIDLGAQGFGNAPRLLTLQDSPFESGFMTPVDITNGGAIGNNGGKKASTPTLADLGWNTGTDVGIGFNSVQTGNSGITLQTLVLTLYNGTSPVGSFSLASPITFSATDLRLQQGNGNALFGFGLTGAEQTTFNTILAANSSALFVGLGSSLGCAAGPDPRCLPSNAGPDSYVGFDRGAPVTVPDGGMTLMLLGSAFVGLETLRRRFRA